MPGKAQPVAVMPALVAGIHVLTIACRKDMDGRDESGHDETRHLIASGLVGEPTAPVIGIAKHSKHITATIVGWLSEHAPQHSSISVFY
jgi:hypothetical protein